MFLQERAKLEFSTPPDYLVTSCIKANALLPQSYIAIGNMLAATLFEESNGGAPDLLRFAGYTLSSPQVDRMRRVMESMHKAHGIVLKTPKADGNLRGVWNPGKASALQLIFELAQLTGRMPEKVTRARASSTGDFRFLSSEKPNIVAPMVKKLDDLLKEEPLITAAVAQSLRARRQILAGAKMKALAREYHDAISHNYVAGVRITDSNDVVADYMGTANRLLARGDARLRPPKVVQSTNMALPANSKLRQLALLFNRIYI